MAFDIVGATDDAAEAAYNNQVGGDQSGSGLVRVRAGDLPLHFAGSGPFNIAPGASAVFTFNLNMQLRPDQLVIPDAVAPRVRVSAFSIGAISVNAGSDAAPGDMFISRSRVKLRAAVSGTPSVPIKVTLQALAGEGGELREVSLGIAGPSKRVN